jgi:hypothetical protein
LLLIKTGSMMTTTPNIPHPTPPGGRTVRDIVETSPALVNEVWCRKLLRQLLQSLDSQYTNGAPHRIIMPDTIVVQPSGDAILLPDPDAIPDFQPDIGADLRALAAVIHFAITHEMPSAGPLLGRHLEGYSDSLLGAVDRCMSPNRSQRPQTVAALRDLLGMVSVGLLKPSVATAPVAAPAPAAPAAVPAPPIAAKTVDLGPPASPRKWLWLGLAAVLLAGALYVVRQHGAEELVGAPVRTPRPEAPAAAPATPPAEPATEAAPAPVAAPAAATSTPDASNYTPETTDNAPAAATTATTAAAAAGNATYRLMVKPWGTIYVDGKRHGVSPPLKRLVLPAGAHTVMLENPGFPDRIVQLDSKRGASGQIAHDFLAGQPTPAPDTTEPAN